MELLRSCYSLCIRLCWLPFIHRLYFPFYTSFINPSSIQYTRSSLYASLTSTSPTIRTINYFTCSATSPHRLSFPTLPISEALRRKEYFILHYIVYSPCFTPSRVPVVLASPPARPVYIFVTSPSSEYNLFSRVNAIGTDSPDIHDC